MLTASRLRALLKTPRLLSTLAILSLALAASFIIFLALRRLERSTLKADLHAHALQASDLLQTKLLRSTEVLYSLRSFFAANPNPTRAQFHAFVASALERQPELAALEWVPRVPHAQRDAFESAARADGFRNFQFTEKDDRNNILPAPSRPEYFPVFYVEPVESNLRAAGYDLLSNPARRTALEQARDSSLLAATAPIKLAQETAPNRAGFLVLLPIYAGPADSLDARRQNLRGFALAVFRIPDLVHASLAPLASAGLSATITSPESSEPLFSLAPPSTPAIPALLAPLHPSIHNLADSFPLQIAGQSWQITLVPAPAFIANRYSFQPWFSLAASLTLTAALGAYLLLTARHTAKLQSEIAIRLRAEQAAENANHAKSRFLATMSHEIRTPMNAVLGYAQILSRDHHLTLSQRRAVETILTAGNHLMSLINAVLDLSKIEAGRTALHPTPLNLTTLTRAVIDIFHAQARQKNLTLAANLPTHPIHVVADESKLRQILINLLSNSLKFTQHGSVTLTLSEHPAPPLPSSPRSTTLTFQLTDTGPGIPLHDQQAIFQPFTQSTAGHHHGGTGLGLTIAQHFLRLMNSSLHLVSQPDHGATFSFTLTLPLADQPATTELAAPRLPYPLHVLVVDDIAENRDLLAHMLASLGCTATTCASAREALDSLHSLTPDLALLDLLMPETDGFILAGQIRETHPRLPLVAITASILSHNQKQPHAAGFHAILPKPLSLETLAVTLKNIPQTGPASHDEKFTLDPALREEIKSAAELCNTTALKHLAHQIPATTPAARRFRHNLIQSIQTFNYPAILASLESLPTATPVPI